MKSLHEIELEAELANARLRLSELDDLVDELRCRLSVQLTWGLWLRIKFLIFGRNMR